MTREQITAASIAVLLVLSRVLSEGVDPEWWAALFWISAIANAVMVMLWYEARDKARRV